MMVKFDNTEVHVGHLQLGRVVKLTNGLTSTMKQQDWIGHIKGFTTALPGGEFGLVIQWAGQKGLQSVHPSNVHLFRVSSDNVSLD